MKFNLRVALVFFICLFLTLINDTSICFSLERSEYIRQLKSKMEQKRRLIEQTEKRLQYEKYRLSLINKREHEVSLQLHKTETELWKVEESIRIIKRRKVEIGQELIQVKDNIKELCKKLSIKRSKLLSRLKSIYMNREIDFLSVVLESDSFSDFVNRMEFIQRIIKSDMSLLREIKFKKEELEQEESRLEFLKEELTGLEKDYRQKQKTYTDLTIKRSELLAEVQYKKNCIANNVYELEVLTREMEIQLEKLIQEAQSFNESKRISASRSEGTFIWPVRGFITSSYGYRMHPIRGRVIFHSGIDIASLYGTPVVATASGIVIYSGWYSGYGNTVIIDHGGGYSSLYAHCSSLFVGNMQKVSQGQTIASVGSTGLSTGPHLHFEIRYNGIPIDPRSKL